MYVRPISALFFAGRSTPAIRAMFIRFLNVLSLTLLMLWVGTNDAYYAFAVDDLAFVAHFLDAGSNFHDVSKLTSTAGRFWRGLGRAGTTPLPHGHPGAFLQNSFSWPRPDAPAPNFRWRASPGPPRWGVIPLPLPPPLRPCQYPRAILRQSNAMLEMGRKGPVLRHRGPFVVQDAHFGRAGVDHRFDGQNHPFFQARVLTSAVDVVGNLRLFVQLRPDPVSHHLAHHRKAVFHYVVLHRSANVEQPISAAGLV